MALKLIGLRFVVFVLLEVVMEASGETASEVKFNGTVLKPSIRFHWLLKMEKTIKIEPAVVILKHFYKVVFYLKN